MFYLFYFVTNLSENRSREPENVARAEFLPCIAATSSISSLPDVEALYPFELNAVDSALRIWLSIGVSPEYNPTPRYKMGLLMSSTILAGASIRDVEIRSCSVSLWSYTLVPVASNSMSNSAAKSRMAKLGSLPVATSKLPPLLTNFTN